MLDTSSGLLAWSGFWPLFGREIAGAYERGGSLFESNEVFWPVTGAPSRPEIILVPKRPEGASEK